MISQTQSLKLFFLIILNLFLVHNSVSQENFKYSDNIEFKIDKVEKWSSIATGNGFYSPEKGSKYFMVFLTFYNKSDKKELVNFKDFHLIDITEKIKYNVDISLAAGPITWIYRKDSKKIKAGQNKKVKLALVCPEDLNPNFLMLENGTIFPIKAELIKTD